MFKLTKGVKMKIAIQNVVMTLGYNELGNASIEDVIQAGMDILDELLAQGVFKLCINSEGHREIEVDDLAELIKEYTIEQNRIPVIKDTKGYVKTRQCRDGQIKVVPIPLVKPTYLFNQSKQNPKAILDIVNKQNSLKWKVNKWVLEFERENKSQTENENLIFLEETALMRDAVENTDYLYLGHRFDKRGRLYSDGYLLNYQSDEWGKCAISPLIKPEKLSKEGIRQFKIDISNHCGLDKSTYEQRLSAFDNAEDTTQVNNGKVKKPLLAHKAILAWEEALANDGLTDYCCGIDATASGMQILAILANCHETAKLTNLTDTSECYDIYAVASEKVLKLVNSPYQVSDIRDIIKKALMTRGYNSLQQIKEAQYELAVKFKMAIRLNQLLDIMDCSEKIKECKEAMNNCLCETFSFLDDEEQIIRYTMPDGFIVEIANITKVDKRYNRVKYGFTMRYDKLGWNRELNWRSLAPNLVHSIDAYICREMIRRCNFQMYTIHDCFYAHPNHIIEMRRTYIQLLKEIQDMNMLEYICKQINSDFEYKADGEKFEIAVDDNSYCLC